MPATLVLSATLTVAAFLLLLPPVHLLAPTVPMPEPLPDNHQTAETALYGLTLLCAALAVLLIPGMAKRWVRRHSAPALGLLAAFGAGGLGLVVFTTRLADRLDVDNLLVLLILAVLWWIVFLVLALRGGDLLRRWSEAPGRPRQVVVAALVLVGLGALSLVDPDHLRPIPLLVCAGIAALILLLRGQFQLPALSGWKGRLIDVAVVLSLLLLVPDVPIYRVGELGGSVEDYVLADTMVFHANLYLGAANEILHGNYLLVGEVSQYGVGLIYALAALFTFVPLDYGTMSIFDGVLSALVFGLGYLILRMAGTGRLLSLGAMVVTVVVLAWGLTFPIGGVLQNGAMRFGLLPVSLIFFRLASLWFEGRGRTRVAVIASVLAWCVVGISAVWALEAMLYTTAALIGLVLAESATRPEGTRWRWIRTQALFTLLAWAAVHIAFGAFTLAVSGELPDWGMYISYLREFLAGNVGQFTYDFQPWTPALLVGAGFVVNLISVVLAIRLRPEWLRADRIAWIALAGLGTYGLVQFSYFANRSLADVLPYLCFPLLLSVTLWLGLLLRSEEVGAEAKRVALAVSLGLAAITVSTVWPDAKVRASDSVLAWGLPGGKSLRQGLDRLSDMPPLKPGADEGERLLETYLPGEQESAVVTAYDLDLNILFRAGRVNRLGIADSKEASWVTGPHYPVMREGVATMEAGDRMLVDEGALAAFDRLRLHPDDIPGAFETEDGLTPIQLEALSLLARKFDLKTVARGEGGLAVVELVPRRAAGSADELPGGQDAGPVQDQAQTGP